jgi:hypothetical protein
MDMATGVSTYLQGVISALKAVDVIRAHPGLGSEEPEQDAHRDGQELVISGQRKTEQKSINIYGKLDKPKLQ